jgi:hypothetical protein
MWTFVCWQTAPANRAGEDSRMSDLSPNLVLGSDSEIGSETPTCVYDAPLPSPSVASGPSRFDGTIVYGLVARVTLNRPGFGFRVEHDLPTGVDLVEARPRATVVGDHLIWQLGRVDPGQEVRLEVVARPQPGVELNPNETAVFTATYSHNLYFQAPVVRPRLTTRLSGPATVERGTTAEYFLDVANIGSWVAGDVQATILLPPELDHPGGPAFAFPLGALNPGEFRRLTIPVRAIERGKTNVRAEVTGSDGRQAVVEFPTHVR